MTEVYCPFCNTYFEGLLWQDDSCPFCGNWFMWQEEYCDCDSFIVVDWDWKKLTETKNDRKISDS